MAPLQLKASELVSLVKKAAQLAAELRVDPFAIKRELTATPEVVVPAFKSSLIDRSSLAAGNIIGYGQVQHYFLLNSRLILAAVRQGVPSDVQGGAKQGSDRRGCQGWLQI